MPDLHSHLVNERVELHMFASQWFLTLYTAKFPLPVVFHILDLYLCEVSLHDLISLNTVCNSAIGNTNNLSSCFGIFKSRKVAPLKHCYHVYVCRYQKKICYHLISRVS